MPWTEVGSFFVGAASAAATAGAFSRRSSRAMKRLHAEAELIDRLPRDAPGRERLSNHLSRRLDALNDLLEREEVTLSKRADRSYPALVVGAGLYFVVIGISNAAGGDNAAWTLLAAIAMVGGLLLCLWPMALALILVARRAWAWLSSWDDRIDRFAQRRKAARLATTGAAEGSTNVESGADATVVDVRSTGRPL